MVATGILSILNLLIMIVFLLLGLYVITLIIKALKLYIKSEKDSQKD